MKILLSNDFKKSVPREKYAHAHKKIEHFINEMHRNEYDYKKISNGFGVKKFKSKNHPVFAFRADSGDRILFMYTSHLNGYRDKEEGILILEYSNHDSQNILATKHSGNFNSINDHFSDDSIQEHINTHTNYFDYDISNRKTIIIPDFDYINNIDSDDKIEKIIEEKDLLQYLSDVQHNIFMVQDSAILLAGSAGTGKTMLGIQKLKSVEYYNCLYLTYTTELKNKVEDMAKSTNISFFDINTFLINKLNLQRNKFVTYIEFESWYSNENHKSFKEFSSFDVWTEIRGIIKGSALIDWIRIDNLTPMISSNDYYKLPNNYSFFDLYNRKKVYKLAQKYQKWLNLTKKYDENDLVYRLITENSNGIYDYLVIDEVQDLTEMQIYACSILVDNKANIFYSGDKHQIINPTYFDFGRLKNMYMKTFDNSINYTAYYLNHNYRSAEDIVKYTNYLTSIRKKKIGFSKLVEEQPEKSMGVDEGFLSFVNTNKSNLEDLLDIVSANPYCAIVVANENDKNKLINIMKDDSQLYTIQEIKGLEDKYIICYNIISNSINEWNEIVDGELSKKSSKHRYIFNLLYVTVTRAVNSVIFYEDKVSNNDLVFEMLFKDKVTFVDNVDIGVLGMTEDFTQEDWFNQAINKEQKGLYKRAKRFFEEAGNYYGAIKGKERCEIKAYSNSPDDFEYIGDMLYDIYEFNDASQYFFKAQLYIKYLNCRVQIDKDIFVVIDRLKDFSISKGDIILKGSEKLIKTYMSKYIDSAKGMELLLS